MSQQEVLEKEWALFAEREGLDVVPSDDVDQIAHKAFEAAFKVGSKATQAFAERPRVVICISGGVVQDVHANDEWTEVLIVDHDNLAARLAENGEFEGAVKADVLRLDSMVDSDENAVRAYEDKEPVCAQCENEFTPNAELPDGGYTFCSITCHDRHWRQ